jgi:hypothetical protein
LDSHLPVHTAVSAIDLKDLLLKIVFRQFRALAEQFPHGLAGQGKALDMTLEVIEFPGVTIDLRFSTLRSSLSACDPRLLINIPKHGFYWFNANK